MDKYKARSLAYPILGAIGIFGLNSMFGQIWRNGYIRRVLDIIASPEPVLPGSQTPLLTDFLGLPMVDSLLTVASVLWADVTNGSTPALSLYAVQFGGQLVPVFLMMMIEGSRSGNTNNTLFFSVLWGYIMQTFGYGITMPTYCIIHLFTSTSFTSSEKALAKATTPRNPTCLALQVLIPAFSLGYFLPSLLMSWPFSSSTFHQWLGAVWQGFPLYIVLFQHLFDRLIRPTPQSESEVLSRAYDWAFNTAAVTQLFTYAVIFVAKAFPGLFPSWASEAFTFGSVFGPGPFYSTRQLTSMAIAMHDFFKWDQYVGSTAAIVWGITLDVTSRKADMSWDKWVFLWWDILRWSVLAGPGGALMRLLQRRDKAIFSEQARNKLKAM